ncbi:MAG TPA: glycosyltransferase family 39 protein [Nitrospirota bacterium]
MKNNILSLPALILLFLLWIIPGLVGREPWKADEPYSFNLVYHMMQSGDWVVPSLTGEPFLEKPPLFFLTAAGFGRLFSPPLELYDATRLAAAFYMFLALLFFALAARELYGKEYTAIAVILLLGCVHLQVTAHKLITDVSLFAGFSIAFYGLSLCSRHRTAGGFWIGTGTGIGFLSKGLFAPGIMGIVAIALPLLFRQWRRKDYSVSLAVALVAALPWVVIWPIALYQRSPNLFLEWFWNQNFGRFLGFNAGSVGFNVASPDAHSYYILNLLWLAWPVVLPAFWSIWFFRRSWREHPLFQVPLVAFIVMLVILSASSTNRALYAVPLLLPITLIAVPGINLLPQKSKIIANRASVLLFGSLGLLLWFGWFAMMTGSPAILAQKLHEFQPDYIPSVNSFLLVAAVLYSLAWLFAVIRITRSPDYAVVNWALGLVLVWELTMTLWLPALNAGSSYRAAFLSLKKSMPVAYSCLASQGLGESERAMLEYFTGLQTRRIEIFGLGNSDLLLEQRSGKAQASTVSPAWQKIWEFRHPNIHPKEIFTLYRKGNGT